MNRPSSSIKRRCFVSLTALLSLLILTIMVAGLAGWITLRGSLAQLDGTHATSALHAPVSIERDNLGVPTIKGSTRNDVAFGTGFVQAQDRYFQMDLLRRVAAGEMSELIGPAALELDRRNRPHRFRERARKAFDALPATQRQLIEHYTAGVNDGLAALASRPFEYCVLRTPPAPWRPEDTLLVVYAMYFDLQSDEVRHILSRAALRERVPADLYKFLLPATSHWDAPFDTAAPSIGLPPPMPATRPDWLQASNTAQHSSVTMTDSMIGSNGWAVDATHSAHGGAILASDMHLGLSLPNIWYRMSLTWPAADGQSRHITGVSLPGAPLVIAGSNERVAWGFTNSYGRFIDLIALQRNPADPLEYRVAGGKWARAAVVHERILVKGGATENLPVIETQWGPQIIVGANGNANANAYALRWAAHDPEAANLNLQQLEDATTVADALHAAQISGIPTQNFMVADSRGEIGWTLAGPLPEHAARDAATDPSTGPLSDLPFDSATYRGWQAYLAPDAYPSRIGPPLGRLWSANNRTLPLEQAAIAGDAGADLGARASQIRDDLFALPHATERDMLAIQTDDRARWIENWRDIALSALDANALKDHPQRAEFRRLIEAWNGRADANATGYRLVRAFYFSLYGAWFGKLDTDLAAAGPRLGFRAASSRYDTVMETLAARRAWVPDGVAGWRAFMLDRIDLAVAQLPPGTRLADATWGERNRAAIEHPFARLVPSWLPWVRGWLGAPRDALPGDINMPRVQAPSFGASERMIVSPGREQDGILEMPGGESGNPLSPYFLAGHDAWIRGDATSFLPGKTVHRLELVLQ
jgi:penicillin amidase